MASMKSTRCSGCAMDTRIRLRKSSAIIRFEPTLPVWKRAYARLASHAYRTAVNSNQHLYQLVLEVFPQEKGDTSYG